MKCLSVKSLLMAAICCALSHSAARAVSIDSSFTNLDFDASTQSYFPGGWDHPSYDIPGWRNYTAVTDGGIEGPGAWWNPYQAYSTFVKTGEGLYNPGSHVIQSGEVFQVSLFAKRWNGNDLPELNITLFYGTDPSMNAIGTFNTGTLTDTWSPYSGVIGSTPASVGQPLGVRVVAGGTWFSNFDEMSISVIPEPASIGLAGFALVGLMAAARRRG